MIQAKKVFRKLCLTNWGGISHKILLLNEYVNLFSGKSGSGKSTAMDALQVILYGSTSSNFLNRAADDNKNKRSVFGYLRGEQKDGSANRADQDFNTIIALELEDVGLHQHLCIGLAFEVRKTDHEMRKFIYFSHSGKMPEQGYINEDGIPFTNKEMRKFVAEREKSDDNRGRGEVNRIYHSKEAYIQNLYNTILGYIDGNRFMTMEKSAIALRMTDGTGQFIKDYMFPRGKGDVIEKLSDQLGAYQDISEKIKDLEHRIDLLQEISDANMQLEITQDNITHINQVLKVLDIEEAREHLEAYQDQLQSQTDSQSRIKTTMKELELLRDETNEEWVKARGDLQATDLGRKKERLEELEIRRETLAVQSNQWRSVVSGLKRWGEDEIIGDYLSQNLLREIDDFVEGKISEEQCISLRQHIASEKEMLREELEPLKDEAREIRQQKEAKQRLIEDIKGNRKSYHEILRKARADLEAHLRALAGKEAKVFIFADLFDVTDPEWKNAVEARMGKLRFALVTAPEYSKEAAKQLRKMKRYDNIDLIHTKKIMDNHPEAEQGSLYEVVKTDEEFVDACLRQYLGRIIMCDTQEELEQAGNGVTKDCFSYQNYMFRQLRKKDYDISFIGTKVSKTKLAQYEQEYALLVRKYDQLQETVRHLEQMYEYETLQGSEGDYVMLSQASDNLEKTIVQIQDLRNITLQLEQGEYKKLQDRERQLHERVKDLQHQLDRATESLSEVSSQIGQLHSDLKFWQDKMDYSRLGYVENPQILEEVRLSRKQYSHSTIRSQNLSRRNALEEQKETDFEYRRRARFQYMQEYPNNDFTGIEKTNERYDEKLRNYREDFEPKYKEEFEKQCQLIYHSLRDNVIAKIHGDIKAAHRHKKDINRLLRETNFSDSRYQIDIEAANNANGQFYEMLMAEELDTKNPDAMEGQISLGEDSFYQKYQYQIQELTDKFMPPTDGDERELEQQREEMEKYADYRNYLSFRMYEVVTDEQGNIIRKNYVDEMAGRDSGGEGQNPKYVALLAGFAMLYMSQTNRDSKIKLVLLDEAFSKMDQERSAVCLQYARKMNLQLIVCVPDERLQSLIQNVDSVYGFRRDPQNQISMMHIDKGQYLAMMEGLAEDHQVITQGEEQ